MVSLRKLYIGLPLVAVAAAGGCASPPPAPLADSITRIPVSDKADVASGIDMEYFMGSQQGFWSHVNCGPTGACWYSGQALAPDHPGKAPRTNPVVARMTASNDVAWARTYQINQNFTIAFGMIPTPDGGALLYGNTLSGDFVHPAFVFQPTFEKLDANGVPEWGGVARIAGVKATSAFQDAASLAGGGFVLVGSAKTNGHWHGVILSIDDHGHESWMTAVSSRGEETAVTSVTQLPDGDILAAGVNGALHDLVLFDIDPAGKIKHSPIVHIRGEEIPLWFGSTPRGPVLIINDTMPSGEKSALMLRLDAKGSVKAASRYRFVDGFQPYGVASMSKGRICIYGASAAKDRKQSLALTIAADTRPVAALAMKGDGVFNSGAAPGGDSIVLAGGRPLGVDQHASGVVVTWDPGLHVDPPLLKKFWRTPVAITVHKDEPASTTQDKNVVRLLAPSRMQSRLVSGDSAAAGGGHSPERINQR